MVRSSIQPSSCSRCTKAAVHSLYFVPKWFAHVMYPIDKSNLHILRLIHFLALAAITIRFVPRDWWLLQRPVLQPIILCGQHSLALFCFGIFLSLAGHIILVEISNRIAVQFLVSAAGIVLMSAAAWLMAHDTVRGGARLRRLRGLRRAGTGGLIRSQRGEILVLNRKGIERSASDCYGVSEAEYRRLIG
jgi:hypothetical protein